MNGPATGRVAVGRGNPSSGCGAPPLVGGLGAAKSSGDRFAATRARLTSLLTEGLQFSSGTKVYAIRG